MISLLTEFVLRCRAKGLIPDESHIEAFLDSVKKLEYKDTFIRICFYHWDELIK